MDHNNLPALADYMVADNAQALNMLAPENYNLVWYFKRYLMQKAISRFEWVMPDRWSRAFFLYVLYCFGRLAIVNTDRYGVIPQPCGLWGYNIYYQPTNAIITNPLLTGILQPRIDVECVLVRLQPDYGGILDLVTYYANLMAQAAEALGVNMANSKTAIAFFTDKKAAAEAYKKAYDAAVNGQPMIVMDKALQMDEQGRKPWEVFFPDVKGNYIADQLLEALRRIEAMFDTDIGIPNANTDKRERLITDEVNANNVETYSKCSLWLETLQESCRKVRDMFGVELSVDWRKIPEAPDLEEVPEE